MNLLGISTTIKNGEDSRKNHAVFKVDSQQIIQAIRSVVEPIPTGTFTDSNQSLRIGHELVAKVMSVSVELWSSTTLKLKL